MIVGLTGVKYSGKTEVSKIFCADDWILVGFGDEVRIERYARNLPEDADLHELGVRLRNEFGPQYVGRRVLSRISKNKDRRYVVDGMRTSEDLEVFRNIPDFVLVGVTAPLEIRWKRCQKRRRADDPKTYDGFLEACRMDESNSPDGLSNGTLLNEVKHTIINDGNLEDLTRKVHNLILKRF
jgi:dephospho-CoA kinase